MVQVGKWVAVTAGVVVTLIFLAFLVMVTRPAILVGVSGERLARSVYGTGEPAGCARTNGGNWLCGIPGSPKAASEVEVDWMGCWKSFSASGFYNHDEHSGPDHGSGCIELGDVITFD